MPDQTIPTRLQFAKGNVLIRNLTRDEIKERRQDALNFFDAGLTMIETASTCGIGNDYLADLARGLHDELTKLSAGMKRDLDERGLLDEWQPIDLADLDALLVRLS